DLPHPAPPEVHVDAAGQAGVEAAHRAHDVDADELVRAVLLEDRRVLDRVLVGPRRAVGVARARVPRGRRVGLEVGNLAAPNHKGVERTPRAASWKPQLIASCGTVNWLQLLVRPAR